MRALIPYTPEDPKSRLAPVMTASERAGFARCMLEDVVEAVRDAGGCPAILSTAPLPDAPAPVTVDERPLSTAVNAALEPPHAIVVADLPLLTPTALGRALEAPGDVVLAPGRSGGTNVLVVRDDAFHVDFHGTSIVDHREIADAAGLATIEVDSHRLTTDVDEPADLVEVLVHGRRRSRSWLRDAGFRLATTEGRVTVTRE